jgi:hypothetical protein
MSEYLYLDIETLPTKDPDIIADLAASITAPKSMSKASTIAEWEEAAKPWLIKEAVAKTSFDGARGTICCIGWAWNDDEPMSVIVTDKTDERGLLTMVSQRLQDKRADIVHGFERPVIVGHYVAGFDLRFIWQRAFVLGVTLPAWFPRDPKPWSDNVHDTMAMWAGAKDSISLDNLCRALGLPGKGNISGADVAGMWERGEHEAVAGYCRGDVERVRSVHRKMLLTMGEIAA